MKAAAITALLLTATAVTASPAAERLQRRQQNVINGATSQVANGTVTCYSPKNQYTPNNFMTVSDAKAAIEEFCNHAQGGIAQNSPYTIQSRRYTIANQFVSQTDHMIDVSAKIIPNNCQGATSFDFKAPGSYQACQSKLMNTINSCDTDRQPTAYTPYSKQGGIYTEGCIAWSLAVDALTMNIVFEMSNNQLV